MENSSVLFCRSGHGITKHWNAIVQQWITFFSSIHSRKRSSALCTKSSFNIFTSLSRYTCFMDYGFSFQFCCAFPPLTHITTITSFAPSIENDDHFLLFSPFVFSFSHFFFRSGSCISLHTYVIPHCNDSIQHTVQALFFSFFLIRQAFLQSGFSCYGHIKCSHCMSTDNKNAVSDPKWKTSTRPKKANPKQT